MTFKTATSLLFPVANWLKGLFYKMIEDSIESNIAALKITLNHYLVAPQLVWLGRPWAALRAWWVARAKE